MREIKFRAYWEDCDVIIPPMDIQKMIHQKKNTFSLKELNKMIFMQYIGIKDCKGKEIYEGDITKEGIIEYGEFEISDGFDSSEIIGWHINRVSILDLGELEIIGNIYENPNLIYKE